MAGLIRVTPSNSSRPRASSTRARDRRAIAAAFGRGERARSGLGWHGTAAVPRCLPAVADGSDRTCTRRLRDHFSADGEGAVSYQSNDQQVASTFGAGRPCSPQTGSTAGGIPAIPGDPSTLYGAASRLGATASAVSDWGSQLGSVTSGLAGMNWSGQGAVSFGSCASALEANHGSASGALNEAATALAAFASVLADCQASVRAAQARVTDAQSAAPPP